MRARRQPGGARRDQIARAVLALAAERGMSAVSVAAVAARVGVSPPALYRHYPSKDAMLDATLERMGETVLANLERTRTEGGDPLEALARLFERHVDVVRESRGLPLLILSEDFVHDPRRRRRLLAMMGAFRAEIERLVRAAQAAGRVRAGLDPATLSLMFFGLFQAPAILWHLTGCRSDLTGHARRGWAVFHDAIRAGDVRPAAPRRRARAKEKPA